MRNLNSTSIQMEVNEADVAEYSDDEALEAQFSQPLCMLNRNVDLDSILLCNSIGDAIQLLCPVMPGLPAKVRGKYKKRKQFTAEENATLTKEQNRENARRTRRRKKLYDIFLSRSIADLESVLYPEKSNNNNEGEAQSSHSSDNNEENIAIPNSKIKKERLKTFRNFILLRISSDTTMKKWSSVCSSNISCVKPVPPYRKISSLANIDNDGKTYVCKGIQALIDDTEKKIEFINLIANENNSGNNFNWKAEIDIKSDSINFNSDFSKLSVFYIVQIFKPANNSNSVAPDTNTGIIDSNNNNKNNFELLITFSANTDVEFDITDGKIKWVEDKFDAYDLEKQFRASAAAVLQRSLNADHSKNNNNNKSSNNVADCLLTDTTSETISDFNSTTTTDICNSNNNSINLIPLGNKSTLTLNTMNHSILPLENITITTSSSHSSNNSNFPTIASNSLHSTTMTAHNVKNKNNIQYPTSSEVDVARILSSESETTPVNREALSTLYAATLHAVLTSTITVVSSPSSTSTMYPKECLRNHNRIQKLLVFKSLYPRDHCMNKIKTELNKNNVEMKLQEDDSLNIHPNSTSPFPATITTSGSSESKATASRLPLPLTGIQPRTLNTAMTTSTIPRNHSSGQPNTTATIASASSSLTQSCTTSQNKKSLKRTTYRKYYKNDTIVNNRYEPTISTVTAASTIPSNARQMPSTSNRTMPSLYNYNNNHIPYNNNNNNNNASNGLSNSTVLPASFSVATGYPSLVNNNQSNFYQEGGITSNCSDMNSIPSRFPTYYPHPALSMTSSHLNDNRYLHMNMNMSSTNGMTVTNANSSRYLIGTRHFESPVTPVQLLSPSPYFPTSLTLLQQQQYLQQQQQEEQQFHNHQLHQQQLQQQQQQQQQHRRYSTSSGLPANIASDLSYHPQPYHFQTLTLAAAENNSINNSNNSNNSTSNSNKNIVSNNSRNIHNNNVYNITQQNSDPVVDQDFTWQPL